jgi:hypothetical protein
MIKMRLLTAGARLPSVPMRSASGTPPNAGCRSPSRLVRHPATSRSTRKWATARLPSQITRIVPGVTGRPRWPRAGRSLGRRRWIKASCAPERDAHGRLTAPLQQLALVDRQSGAYPGVKLLRYTRTRPHEPDLRLEKPQLNGHIDTLCTIGASLWNCCGRPLPQPNAADAWLPATSVASNDVAKLDRLARTIARWEIPILRCARALGVPRTRISEIIRGERHVSADTALRLARSFGA